MGDGTTRWPVGQSQAISRAADALVRAAGGTQVVLLFPLSIGGGTLSELGAAGQTAEQVIFCPASVRSVPVTSGSSASGPATIHLEISVPASTVNPILDARQVDTGEDLFTGSLGVLFEGRLLCIRKVVTEHFAEAAYLFVLTVTD